MYLHFYVIIWFEAELAVYIVFFDRFFHPGVYVFFLHMIKVFILKLPNSSIYLYVCMFVNLFLFYSYKP